MGFTLSSGNMFVILLNFIPLFSAFCFYRSIFYCYRNASEKNIKYKILKDRSIKILLWFQYKILISNNYNKI
jgi:hypothetical protein